MANPYDWPRAREALQRLLANPDDTQQVFVIISALSGHSPRRMLQRLARDSTGARLLRSRSDLLPILLDRASLRALPDGSLGRAYLRFVESEGISADGLVQASQVREPDAEMDPELDYLRGRMRDTHDLWHAVTGYKGDLIGEAALLAFTLVQTRNPGIGLIVAAAFLRGRELGVRREIGRGLLRGLRARWLVAFDWERALSRPLAEVRRELRLGPPPAYRAVRTSQLMPLVA